MSSGDKTVVNTASGPLDRVRPEAPGANMLRRGGPINHNPNSTDIRFLTGKSPAGNLGTGNADFSAEEHVFLTDITLRHLVHLLAFCCVNAQMK
jgi:hypothetical protein